MSPQTTQGRSSAGSDDATGQEKANPSPLWFLRFFPSAWTTTTRGWQPAEKGIWIDLFVMMHQRGEPVPEDSRRLARACGTTEALFKKVLEMLIAHEVVFRCPDGLWSADVEAEVAHRKDRSAKARENSSERWRKSKQKQGPGNPDAYANKSIEIEGGSSSRPSEISSSTIGDGREVRPEGAPSTPSQTRLCRPGFEFETERGTCVVLETFPQQRRVLVRFKDTGEQKKIGVKADIRFDPPTPVDRSSGSIEPPEPSSASSKRQRALG
ncbi:YdaU family protein [Mesorhizobium sp. M0959]|uniref:DUF1376 domain-containing protein n=1 Tax=Mesorhizobium sp. M0959 TaxID=2957034 RepID=UPI00333591B8